MKVILYRGLRYVELENSDKIEEKPLVLDKVYHVGHVFDKIGNTDRTTLNPGYPMKYVGMLDNDVLLEPIIKEEEVQENQLSLFEVEKRVVYLAPSYVNQSCLLMQSSGNGFWDIRI